MLSVRLSVNKRLLEAKLWGNQKLYLNSPPWKEVGVCVPNPHVFQGSIVFNLFLVLGSNLYFPITSLPSQTFGKSANTVDLH